MVCQSNDAYERETINIKALAANRVAGILVSTSQETVNFAHLKTVLKQGIPLVLFDRIVEELQVSKVIVDDFEGAYKAVTHLIENGRTRIAHLAGNGTLYVSRKRREGYEAALRDHGLPLPSEYVISGGYHEEDGRSAARKLCRLHQLPDAVFAINDPVALGAFNYFQQNNIAIPDQIALVGFSNNPNTALVTPRLTTVSQPAFEMGKTAASLLLQKLNHKDDNKPPETVILKTKLVVRESS